MAGGSDPILKLVKQQGSTAQLLGSPLSDLFRALKASSFYPKGHPLRSENLVSAYSSLVQVISGVDLQLVISRSGIATTSGEAIGETNPLVLALARELLVRRIQRITFLSDLSENDVQSFLAILTVDPQKIVSTGGIESFMTRHGVTSIWVNEIDLSVIWEKRRALEAQGRPLTGFDEESFARDFPETDEERHYTLEELLDRMDGEGDDNRYLLLARELNRKAGEHKESDRFFPLLPALNLLLSHASSSERSDIKKEYAIFTLEQIAAGKMLDFLLRHLEDRECPDRELIYRTFAQLGEKVAYVIIQRLCIADALLVRKALAVALVRIGKAAVSPVAAMLRDERWYVVRNMVAILGELGSRDAVPGIRNSLHHSDQRVRKEAIRSLMKIGGKESETMIISLLADTDTGIVRQAILSLGLMKCTHALPHLFDLLEAPDMMLKQLPVKIEAATALGRIGDRRATTALLGILGSTFLFAWKRGEELKIAAAKALGQLGDETALPLLKNRANRGGRLGIVCGEAVDNIERLAGEAYE